MSQPNLNRLWIFENAKILHTGDAQSIERIAVEIERATLLAVEVERLDQQRRNDNIKGTCVFKVT